MKFSKLHSVILLAGLSLFLAGCLPIPTQPSTPSETAPATEETEANDAATTVTQSAEPTSEPEVMQAPEKTDEELIKEAFQRKHPDWDLTQMDFTVKENTGQFATGGVGPKGGGPGGGMFFAANTQAGWVVAWDGNGTIECSDIEPYNFPTSMIPECYNSLTQQVVVR